MHETSDTRPPIPLAADPDVALLGLQRCRTGAVTDRAIVVADADGRLLEWLGGLGTVCLIGIEGTGSYGGGPNCNPNCNPGCSKHRW